jgi:predicted dehydrogenase
MIRVGVIGLGMMGLTHLDAYAAMEGVRVSAIADADANRLSGNIRAQGNIEGQAQGRFDFASVQKFSDGLDLIRDAAADVIDVCLPTPLHLRFALAAMQAGKHVLIEKPLARTAADADQLAAAAAKAGVIAMPGMCMRFWPGWTWLKNVISERAFGKVFAAQFRRVAAHPGGAFYSDANANGGAALDLHIHDADFVRYCFGDPISVQSRGYSKVTTGIDHILTQYNYGDVPLVSAEGSWAMSGGFPFRMQYTVNFERATAVFDSSAPQPLMLYQGSEPPRPIEIEPGMGYEREIAYFMQCVKEKRQPAIVTVRDGAEAVRLVEAEMESIRLGWPVAPPRPV